MKPISIIVNFDAVHSLFFNYLEPVLGGSYLLCLDYTRLLDYELEVFLLGEQYRDMVGEDITDVWLEELCPMVDLRESLKRDIRRTIFNTVTRVLGENKIPTHHYEYQRLNDPLDYVIVDNGDCRERELRLLREQNAALEERLRALEEGE